MQGIPIVVDAPERSDPEHVKGFLYDETRSVALCIIPVDKLRENFGKVAETLAKMLEDIKSVGAFELAEVEVGVEVTAEGGINLIGSSKIGGKAAIKLKFSKGA